MILEKEFYSRNSLFRSTAMILQGFGTMVWKILFGKKREGIFRSERRQFKGLPYLLVDDKNQLACTNCGRCQEICPTDCLKVSNHGKLKVSLEVLNCMFCGLCEEVCQEDALRMGPERSLAGHAEQSWVWDQKFLAFRPSLNNGRGVRVGEPHPDV